MIENRLVNKEDEGEEDENERGGEKGWQKTRCNDKITKKERTKREEGLRKSFFKAAQLPAVYLPIVHSVCVLGVHISCDHLFDVFFKEDEEGRKRGRREMRAMIHLWLTYADFPLVVYPSDDLIARCFALTTSFSALLRFLLFHFRLFFNYPHVYHHEAHHQGRTEVLKVLQKNPTSSDNSEEM